MCNPCCLCSVANPQCRISALTLFKTVSGHEDMQDVIRCLCTYASTRVCVCVRTVAVCRHAGAGERYRTISVQTHSSLEGWDRNVLSQVRRKGKKTEKRVKKENKQGKLRDSEGAAGVNVPSCYSKTNKQRNKPKKKAEITNAAMSLSLSVHVRVTVSHHSYYTIEELSWSTALFCTELLIDTSLRRTCTSIHYNI